MKPRFFPDDDGSVFEVSPSLSPYLKEEDKNASVTDPRLLSRGGEDDGAAAVETPGPNTGDDAGAEAGADAGVTTDDVTADAEADAGGDVTTDDVTLEEPEMTLARGGSTLGGDISSFDENLTLRELLFAQALDAWNGSPIITCFVQHIVNGLRCDR